MIKRTENQHKYSAHISVSWERAIALSSFSQLPTEIATTKDRTCLLVFGISDRIIISQ